jgi:hypothetical protein
MILNYPPTSANDTITLSDHQAEMGNAEVSGVSIVFSNNKLTKSSKYQLTTLTAVVKNLTSVQAQTLLTFFTAHLGELVRYTDHNSKIWDVTILKMSEIDKDSCDYTISMTMSGVPV